MIYEALTEYRFMNYELIDVVPYIVDADVSACTKPTDVEDLHHINGKVYIASGEQSFIQLMKDGMMDYGKFCCITPCFRNEPIIDDLHHKMFLKIELIEHLEEFEYIEESVLEMVNDALTVMSNMCARYEYDIIKTDAGYDITQDGIEVGSYGYRETPYGKFVYGTGLAIPRFRGV